MKFVDGFATFLTDEVNLNKTRLDRLDQSVSAIEDYLAEHPTFEDGFRALIPAGSWAHRTIICPVGVNSAFDADVLLPVTYREDWLPKDYIQQLYSAFRDSETYKSKAKRKTRCVRIDYEGEVHIDVVPFIERDGHQYITNRLEPEDEGAFELSNPEGFTDWVETRQRWAHGHFIKVVRLVKYLRDFKGTFGCKSIILKTLLGNQLTEADESDGSGAFADVPSTLVTLMERLAAAMPLTMPQVLDPGETGDDFAARYKDEWDYPNFRKKIKDYAEKMRAAYNEPDRTASLNAWQDIFGEEFHAADTGEKRAAAPISYSAAVPWQGEQHIDRVPYSHPIRLNPRYHASVVGRVTGLATKSGIRRRGFGPYNLPTRGNRVAKGLSLTFTARTTVPAPYSLFWKVRNGGAEAAKLDALRGEITRDQGNGQKTETTLYTGSHYVECYVVKDGVVVAKAQQPVRVTW